MEQVKPRGERAGAIGGDESHSACVSLRLGLSLRLDLIDVVRIKGRDRRRKSPLNVEHLCKIGFGESVLIVERVKETALQISLAVAGIELYRLVVVGQGTVAVIRNLVQVETTSCPIR